MTEIDGKRRITALFISNVLFRACLIVCCLLLLTGVPELALVLVLFLVPACAIRWSLRFKR